MEKIVPLTGTKQRHPETIIRNKERSRERKNEISSVTEVELIKQRIRIYERYLEEIKAFETFVKELRQIKERGHTVGLRDFSSWGTSLPSDAEKIVEEIVYIKTLAGICLDAGIEQSCGNLLQDLANLAENLDQNIAAIRLRIQQRRMVSIEELSVLEDGPREAKVSKKETAKLTIIKRH